MQYLKKTKCLIEPQSFEIGEICDDKKINSATIWTKKKCYGYIIPLRIILKMFLELPNVFEEILLFIKNEVSQGDQGKYYSSIFNAEFWRHISKNNNGSTTSIFLP